MDRPDARDGLHGWAALHGGLQPSGVVAVWLRGVQALAALPPVRRLPPDLLSAAGVGAAAGAFGAGAFGAGALGAGATGGRGWLVVAAALVVLVGLLDGLDGAVAVATGRARPLGAVVDAVADRLGDLLLAGTLVVLGAPPGWCAAAAALVLLHEYLRARAQAAGMAGIGALTVAERPTRLVLVAVACAGSAALPAGTPGTGWGWATVTAVAWTAVGLVGLAQLARGVVRTAPAGFPPERPEP